LASGSTYTLTLYNDAFLAVEIESKDHSKWYKCLFKIDSGALITAMDSSWCSLFGYVLHEGKKIGLSPVGHNKLPFYLHRVNMRIGNEALTNVPIAFSECEIGEPLLGCVGICDSFNISFQMRFAHTIFSLYLCT